MDDAEIAATAATRTCPNRAGQRSTRICRSAASALVAFVIVLAAGACSSSSKSAAAPTSMTTAAAASSTATRFNVPLPPGAHLAGGADAAASADSTAFKVASYPDLLTWLNTNMPVGQDFGDWKWCAKTSGDLNGSYWRTYLRKPGLKTSLVVASSKESDGTGGLVVGVQDDDGGGC